MTELLKKYQIYFNEVDKVCVLDPKVTKQCNDLKEECQIYVAKIEEFQKITDKFINLVRQFGVAVEKEKMRAIGARNTLYSMEKQKENTQQQMQALIGERTMELERLKTQLNTLKSAETQQIKVINQLTHH